MADTSTLTRIEDIPRGKYGVIYADPPWAYRTWTDYRPSQRLAQQHYDVMQAGQIGKMPVADLAARDCALFMWATMPLLPEALQLMSDWGFEYKTNAFTWVKTYPNGGLFVGMGYWTRSNPEICLLGVRGKPKRLQKGVEEVIFEQVGRHSSKPETAAHRIEQLVSGPYLEMFARRPRRGWDVFGNQVEHDIITLAEAGDG